MTGLPTNIPRRCLSLAEAAEYCGMSPGELTRRGPAPIKSGSRVLYDRYALDVWLDRLSGIGPDEPEEDPEQTLLKAIHARKAALRHPPH